MRMETRSQPSLATGERRASAPTVSTQMNASLSTGSIFTPEEWQKRLASNTLSTPQLAVLVLNYLVIEGYKEAALHFVRESGDILPSSIAAAITANLGAIEERMAVRSAIQGGRIEEAIHLINELDPDLLDSQPQLSFRLIQQQFIELVREEKLDEAIEFAQEELAPRAELNAEFLRDLEKSLTLLVFSGIATAEEAFPLRELLDPNHRMRVANEINSALLAAQSQENESKLPLLLKTLNNLQDSLSLHMTFPKIVDFCSATFKPPCP